MRFKKMPRSWFHFPELLEISNIDKNVVQSLISKLIDLNVVTVKKTKQDHKSVFLTKKTTTTPTEDNTIFIVSNDENESVTPVDLNDIDLTLKSTKSEDYGNAKLNPSNYNYVSMELFGTSYDEKYYVNVILQNISSNKVNGESFENEINSQ